MFWIILGTVVGVGILIGTMVFLDDVLRYLELQRKLREEREDG